MPPYTASVASRIEVNKTAPVSVRSHMTENSESRQHIGRLEVLGQDQCSSSHWAQDPLARHQQVNQQ